MKTVLKNNRGISLVVVLMVMVLLLSITGAGLLFSGTGLRTAGAFRAGTQALNAADTGISHAVSRLDQDVAIAKAAIGPITVGDGTTYRSGPRNAGGAVAFADPTIKYPSDCSLTSGMPGYSGSQAGGCISYRYQVNMTGSGPVGATREIEAQIEFGPVPVQ